MDTKLTQDEKNKAKMETLWQGFAWCTVFNIIFMLARAKWFCWSMWYFGAGSISEFPSFLFLNSRVALRMLRPGMVSLTRTHK